MKSLSKLIPKDLKEIVRLLINYVYPRNITCIICDNPIKLNNTILFVEIVINSYILS